MTTFARIVNGVALDVHVCDTLNDLIKRFHPQWFANHGPFSIVPDGTLHGAKDNGDGTFTNIAVPAPEKHNLVLTRKALRAHIVKSLGDYPAASARLQSYLDDAAADVGTTTASKNRRYALETLRQDDSYTKSETSQLMSALQFTAGDKNAVLSNWPQT